MNDIEKIKAKIDRLYDDEVPKHDQQCDFGDGYFRGIATIENFIDSMLEEKPSEDLEEEMDRYFDTMQVFEHENIFEETFHKIARHFAEWGAKHLK